MSFFQKVKLQVACNDLFDSIFLLVFSLFGSGYSASEFIVWPK